MRKVPGVNTHIFKQPDIPWGGLGFPATLSPKLWLDATDLNYLTLSGTDVITLGDKSGNGYDFPQATPANRPVIDSATNPTKITFTAANSEFLDGSDNIENFKSDTYFEYWTVVDVDLTNTEYLLGFSDQSFNQDYLILNIQSNGKCAFWAYTDGINNVVEVNNALNIGKHVVGYIADGSSYKFIVDNVESGINVVLGSNIGLWIGDYTNKNNLDKLTIGSRHRNPIDYSNAIYREGIGVSTPTNTTQRNNIYSYLANKHSL
jgi:hypothetical protein